MFQDNKLSSSPLCHGKTGITNGASSNKKLPPGLKKPGLRFNLEGAGGDSVTGSLEDLVNSFDFSVSRCFVDYQEQVDKIAPVQVSRL